MLCSFAVYALPFTYICCRCPRLTNPLRDHRTSCNTSGTLSKRGYSLGAAVTQVVREAGTRVRTNQFLRDLNIAGTRPPDGRRIKIGEAY